MTFVTRLTLQCGDRAVLESVVSEISAILRRKGAEMKGPHPETPRTVAVPLYAGLERGDVQFDSWSYTVYVRTIEIVGHDAIARMVAKREYPRSVHLEVEIRQIRSMGST